MNQHLQCLSSTLLLLIAMAICMGSHKAMAERLIRTSISFDGNVILEGSWSDNGKPDADEVWGILGAITFKPTAAFQAQGVDPTAKQVTLPDERKGVGLGSTQLKVDIAYEGESNCRKLTLTRVPKNSRGGEWKLAAQSPTGC